MTYGQTIGDFENMVALIAGTICFPPNGGL
jgi:hypothetical protein